MTPEQIEAKALEEFPVRLPAKAFGYAISEQDQNASRRAAFIKGCQYAATPSGVSREEAEKWAGIQAGNLGWVEVGCAERTDIIKVALAMYDHLASLSAAQPDAETMKVLDECLQKEYSKTPTRLDESSPAQPGFSEWISVKDRLPEPTLDVVLLIDHFCETKNYYEVTKWDGGQINSWRVTHWMPLPSPPLNPQP